MDNAKPKSPFVRSLVVTRDRAIAFIKSVGFVETGDANVFTRDSERSAVQKDAGARSLTTVNVDELIARSALWRAFVARWSRKLAAKAKP